MENKRICSACSHEICFSSFDKSHEVKCPLCGFTQKKHKISPSALKKLETPEEIKKDEARRSNLEKIFFGNKP